MKFNSSMIKISINAYALSSEVLTLIPKIGN